MRKFTHPVFSLLLCFLTQADLADPYADKKEVRRHMRFVRMAVMEEVKKREAHEEGARKKKEREEARKDQGETTATQRVTRSWSKRTAAGSSGDGVGDGGNRTSVVGAPGTRQKRAVGL